MHVVSIIMIFLVSIKIVYEINFEDLIGDINIFLILLWLDILFTFNTRQYYKGIEVTDRWNIIKIYT